MSHAAANVTIRPAVAHDLHHVHELISQHVLESKATHAVDLQTLMDDSGLLSREKYPLFRIQVAEKEDKSLVGYALFYCYKTASERIFFLDDLFVRQDMRGEKIGFRLLHRMAAMSKDHDCDFMRLHVADWNAKARDFYQKCGFHWNGVQVGDRLEYEMDRTMVEELCSSH